MPDAEPTNPRRARPVSHGHCRQASVTESTPPHTAGSRSLSGAGAHDIASEGQTAGDEHIGANRRSFNHRRAAPVGGRPGASLEVVDGVQLT